MSFMTSLILEAPESSAAERIGRPRAGAAGLRRQQARDDLITFLQSFGHLRVSAIGDARLYLHWCNLAAFCIGIENIDCSRAAAFRPWSRGCAPSGPASGSTRTGSAGTAALPTETPSAAGTALTARPAAFAKTSARAAAFSTAGFAGVGKHFAGRIRFRCHYFRRTKTQC